MATNSLGRAIFLLSESYLSETLSLTQPSESSSLNTSSTQVFHIAESQDDNEELNFDEPLKTHSVTVSGDAHIGKEEDGSRY